MRCILAWGQPPIESPEAPTFRPQLTHFQPATASRRLRCPIVRPRLGPPSLCLIPAASTQLQLSPRSLLAGAGNMERPRQTRLLIRRSGTARGPKQIQVYCLPAAVIQENTGAWIIRYETNLRSTDGRTSCTEARAAQCRYLSAVRPAAASLPPAGQRRGTGFILSRPASRNLDSFNLTPSCALPLSPALALSLLALLFFSLSGLAEKNEKEKKRNCFKIVSQDTTSSRDEAALF
ncbi:hypothetical protein HDV64DRAFT_102968 [Trichoderma sp. TUCIM 5745]